MTALRTKPTGHRVLIVRSLDPHEWWDVFLDYLEPKVNDFDLQYADAYATTAEWLLDKLACCGWEEEDRGQIEVINPICVHRGLDRHCTNQAKLTSLHVPTLRCTDAVRVACAATHQHYQPKYVVPMIRNYVWIKKIGPIKNFSRR